MGEMKPSSNWHTLPEEEILDVLSTDREGLSKDIARQRLKEHGNNVLKGEEGESFFSHVLNQLKSPLIYLLLLAAVVSFIAGKHIDTIIIAAVVALNTSLGVIQEWRAEKALAALKQLSAPRAAVLRDGDTREVKAADVVPGDVLILERGDRVAADARLLSDSELEVNESSLTGESKPVAKHKGTTEEDTPLADRTNMVFMSTLVTSGRGRAVVVGTGMDTAMGGIAGEMRATERELTPLQRRLSKLSIWIGALALGLAGMVFLLGVVKGYELTEMLLYSVAVAVSAIPEGLPAVISVTLALGVHRMAERNAVIRRLPAVETLGSTTVICADKTGTITENQMTVVRIWTECGQYEVTGEGYAPEGEIKPVDAEGTEGDACLDMLLRIGCLANDASLVKEEDSWRVEGSPTEGALLVVASKQGLDCPQLRQDHPRRADVPFSSDRKYMAALHEFPQEERTLLLVKGAPERIFDFCSSIQSKEGKIDLDDTLRKQLDEANHDLADAGLRVVAAAWKELSPERRDLKREEIEEGLTLAGMWGLVDPPRAEAVQAIENAHKAGIRVVMITGDHASTARSIGTTVGIAGDEESVMTGSAVEGMEQDELASRVEDTDVMARVSPSHKLKIMESLKDQGEIVAMTGDGVNDAPALKGADIGIAMGRTGTEVAREAADMVLTDDNFATIVAAVEEGRVIFNNLRRVVFFLLTTSAGEVLTLVGALLMGLPLPVTAGMILWINLLTDGVSDVPLGVEPKHRDVLDQPPRPPQEGIVEWTTLRRILLLAPVMAAGVLVMFWVHLDEDFDYARTMAFTTLAAFQWFHALNARSSTKSIFQIGLLTNRWLCLGLFVAVLLQLGTVYLEMGQTLFGTVPLDFMDWAYALLAGSSILVVDEILKLLGVHQKSRPRAHS